MALTKVYKIEVDGQQAAATVGQLKAEIEKLEGQLDNVQLGSPDADRLVAQLGRAKAALNDLDEQVEALRPKNMAGAFADAASGVAGAFGIMTVAAEKFGLSQESAAQYQQTLMELMTVVQSVESVHRALTAEALSAYKAGFESAKGLAAGWFKSGEAATASSRVTRGAMAATGIGLLLLLLGLVVANWDKITDAVERNRAKVFEALKYISPPLYYIISGLEQMEKRFGSLSALASGLAARFTEAFRTVGDEIGALLSGDFTEAERIYAERGARASQAFHNAVKQKNAELAIERSREAAAVEAEELARRLAVAKAAGQDTYALELRLLTAQLSALKSGTKEELKVYKDKYNEILTLQAGHDRELAADADKARKEEASKRKQAAADSLRLLKERLQKEREAHAKARALLEADEDFAVALLSAQGKETLDLQIEQLQRRLKNNRQASAEERELRDKDSRALELLLTQRNKREADLDAEAANDRAEGRGQEIEAQRNFVQQFGQAVQQGLADTKAKAPPSIADTILTRFFGVAPDQVEDLKAKLVAASQLLMDAAFTINDLYFATQQERVEAEIAGYEERLKSIQEQGKDIDTQLNQATRAREQAESALAAADKATGARREALIARVTRERVEETRLAREKAKNAAEELRAAKLKEDAEKRRHELQRKSQILAEAAQLAANGATAAEAILAGVRAVAGANAIPFPGNLPALIAAIAATASAIGSAKKLGATLKGEQGGLLEGPSHALGGIQGTGRFANIEVEGGEALTNRRATANNLGTLATINKYGSRVQFIAVPKAMVTGASGGRLTEAGGLAADGNPAGPGVVLSSEQAQQMVALLAKIAGHTGALEGFGPPSLEPDPPTARRWVDKANRESADANGGKLL